MGVINEPFDPWDPAHRADPHVLYREMRERAPVYRGVGPETGRSIWFLTRYDDVLTALRDPRLGREWRKLPEEVREQHHFEQEDAFEMVNRHLLNLDPPDHTRLRRLVSSAFTPSRVRELEPRIQEIADDLLAAFDGGEVDLIEQYAAPLPVTVIAELLGVPIDDREWFRSMVDRLLRSRDFDDSMAAGFEMIQYVNEAIEQRRTEPGDDLLSALIHIEEEGDRLDHAELLSMVQLLLIAGHETTVNLIGNGMLELMRHRDELDRLVADSALLESAVEEMLRFQGPVETPFPRFAYASVELGGETIPQGDLVVPVLHAANRDPGHFEEPDRFDIGRDPNRHLAFGFGIHHCLGAPLARLEGRIAIGSLLERHRHIALAADPATLEWTPDFFLRGVRRLPVRL